MGSVLLRMLGWFVTARRSANPVWSNSCHSRVLLGIKAGGGLDDGTSSVNNQSKGGPTTDSLFMSLGNGMSVSFSRCVVVPERAYSYGSYWERQRLLNVESEMYFGLDEVGYRMWIALAASDSIEAAYEQLLSEYEVEPEKLRESLDTLLSQCTVYGLL
jgi:hypothetical protein